MTVQDLINTLQAFPRDAKVCLADGVENVTEADGQIDLINWFLTIHPTHFIVGSRSRAPAAMADRQAVCDPRGSLPGAVCLGGAAGA
jgi:hypothetical protein